MSEQQNFPQSSINLWRSVLKRARSVVVVRGFTVQQAKLSRFLVVSAVVAESVILCPRAKTAACGTVRRYDADFAFALGLIRVNPPGSI